MRPAIFGEILYDRFPDGTAVLGGAPFNVCRHLRQLDFDPLMVTRIGDDDAGKLLLREIDRYDLDPAGIQIDPDHPTGEVLVKLDDDGEAVYTIAPNQAWDHIEPWVPEEFTRPNDPPDLLYAGSLALRTPEVQARFIQLADELPCPIYIDINLRQDWWSPELAKELLHLAFCFKCNEHEFATLFGKVDPNEFREQHELDFLLLTRGERGLSFYSYRGTFHADPPKLKGPIIDTVGAGDAAAAVSIVGYLRDWHPKRTVQEAVRRAAQVCRVQGAALDW